MRDPPRPSRRSFFGLLATSGAGVGIVAAGWPLIRSMAPAADVVAADQVFVDTSTLNAAEPRIVSWRHLNVMVLRRSEVELHELEASEPRTNRSRAPKQVSSGFVWEKSWYRSVRPDVAVLHAICPFDWWAQVVLVQVADPPSRRFRCPYCLSAFDLAGRVLSGPSGDDLGVPPHRFLNDRTLVIGGSV